MVGRLQPSRRMTASTRPISSRSDSGVKRIFMPDGESQAAPSASVQSRGSSIAVPSCRRMETCIPASMFTSNV